MATVKKSAPISAVTNPLLLWLFKHGWEDPGWGQSHIGQISIASAIHEMASQITDVEIRKQLQNAAAKAMANSATKIASAK